VKPEAGEEIGKIRFLPRSASTYKGRLQISQMEVTPMKHIVRIYTPNSVWTREFNTYEDMVAWMVVANKDNAPVLAEATEWEYVVIK